MSCWHQNFGADRLTYDDWLRAEYSVQNVMSIYDWVHARFWTDALFRLYKLVSSNNGEPGNDSRMTLAEIGLRPFHYGLFVVLNIA